MHAMKFLPILCILQVFGKSLRREIVQKVLSKDLLPQAINASATDAATESKTQDDINSGLPDLRRVDKNNGTLKKTKTMTCPKSKTVVKVFMSIQAFLDM